MELRVLDRLVHQLPKGVHIGQERLHTPIYLHSLNKIAAKDTGDYVISRPNKLSRLNQSLYMSLLPTCSDLKDFPRSCMAEADHVKCRVIKSR